MKKSISKIRHIENSNLLLEKRFLNEQGTNELPPLEINYPAVSSTAVNIPGRNYKVGSEEKAEKSYQQSKHMATSEQAKFATHLANAILGVAVSFVPVVGPLAAIVIGMADAQKYLKDGDTKTAGLTALFSLIPVAGQILGTTFKIAKFAKPDILKLQNKLLTGQQLTKVEMEALDEIAKNHTKITQGLETLAAKEAAKPTASAIIKSLPTLAKNVTTSVVKSAVPYVAAYAGYEGAYQQIQANTPQNLASSEGMDWKKVKEAFGSSGSLADNTKLQTAWKEGWRPGSVVPEKYQTDFYKKNYQEENENINKLNAFLAAKLNK